MRRNRFGVTIWIFVAAAIATASAAVLAGRYHDDPQMDWRKASLSRNRPTVPIQKKSSSGKSYPGVVSVLCFVLCIGLAALLGFLREPLILRSDPAVVSELEKIRLMPNGISGAPPEVDFALGQPYEGSSYNLAQGKRLYTWFGCTSCHGDGRGGNGPSFLDGWWLYGPEMVSIVSSIRDGRPHGMPPFKDKMPIEQIWQLAGYVQSIGAYQAKVVAPGRNDSEHTRPTENRAPASIYFEPVPVHADPEQGPKP
jgi:cytochrome c oxidase cbb3-type subunit 3